MWLFYYLMPVLWFLYLTAFEVKVVTTDKALKKEGKLVNPDFKTISHLRYISAVITSILSLIVATLLALSLPSNVIAVYTSAVAFGIGTPFLNWLWFYNALHPLLAKHGVFTTSRILESNRREAETNKGSKTNWVVLRVEYTFHALDGSSLSSEVEGEAMDSGDKATSKALSMADKYALIQLFKIPTDDTADADKDTFIQERIESNKPRITEEQVSEIKAFIKEHGVSELKFLQYLRTNKVESISMIPAEHFDFFMAALEKSAKKGGVLNVHRR